MTTIDERLAPRSLPTMTGPSRPRQWAGYAACGWALLFAALTFYWAAGGQAGISTLSRSIREPALARETGFVAVLWLTGVLKVLAGVIALALVRPWGTRVPRWLLLVAAWGMAALLILYGGLGMIGALLSQLGVTTVAAEPGIARWYLFLWDPIWLVGGLLFLATVWEYTRADRVPIGTARRTR